MARDEDPESADLARERELEWQQIVDNYGERPVLEPEDELDAVQPRADHDDHRDHVAEPIEIQDRVPPEEQFVPPAPPPIPRPTLDRGLAWLGVFGVPTVVLVLIVAGISVPSWFGVLMAACFLGGFGYLVVKMSNEPRDPWDDGAVL